MPEHVRGGFPSSKGIGGRAEVEWKIRNGRKKFVKKL